jgi:hypothetical protein
MTRQLNPREKAPGTRWIGGYVGPRAVLDAVMKRKISSPRRESNPRTPLVQPINFLFIIGTFRIALVSYTKVESL